MGWNNPPLPWPELERRLSGRPQSPGVRTRSPGGGDQPAEGARPAEPRGKVPSKRAAPAVPYAELHVHSNFSFLDGASAPEALAGEAVRLGLGGMALTDHDGLYGVARFAEAAERHPGFATVFGAELSLGLGAPQNGVPDPEGEHLVVLARGFEGYRRLSAAISEGQLAGGEKGRPVYELERLAALSEGNWVVLTGCRKGLVPAALARNDPEAAAAGLDRLGALFGRENVFAELVDHGNPVDQERNDALAGLAAASGIPVLATNNVHYAAPRGRRLASVVAAVRANRSLDELDGWLPASGLAHLRSGAEQAARFARYPGAVERTVPLARELAFELRRVRPGLPDHDVPEGHTPMSWLRELAWQGAAERYPDADESVRERLDRELAVIEEKDFPGYFLIVHDIVRFARSRGILCQGRGSAANSAICYVLGITAVDSIFYDLPFERFLSSLREEEPDIDVDFDSDRREEVIQYVYGRYGRLCAAQVANVISYRPKNAVRDVAKALGHGPGQQDAWSKAMDGWGREIVAPPGMPEQVALVADELLKAPRHLGIHSGGMVLTKRPVGEVCPIEHARMPGRTVLQWDKDDCAWMGLVKFDLLGLGMLAALQYLFDIVAERCGETWRLETMPREEAAVYDMLCRGDAIGVFQVESRAQLATLPRLKPRCFYDLVIEIALIRPGPIQGGAVHPYLRRRTGQEKVYYLHPLLKPVLERTLGVPLFQEQLMQMAVAVGGCSAEDADLLRRAMGSKRGVEKIDSLREKLYTGMAANGITGESADGIYARIEAFANFGFAESHSLSFALLVYASSWLKLHYPGAFLAALLRAQPMGFYSPQSLTADARRHGVEVRGVDILRSAAHADLEPLTPGATGATGHDSCLTREQPTVGPFDPAAPDASAGHRRDGAFAVRLGLASVTGIALPLAERIVAEREGGPYRSLADLAQRTGLNAKQLEALSAAGAFDGLGLSRRQALWNAGPAARERADQLPGTGVVVQPPLLPSLSPAERLAYELWSTGISPGDHPFSQLRRELDRRGVRALGRLRGAEPGRRIEAAGVVTHRQRPATARGVVFLNLEDETGMLNVICSIGVWNRYRSAARDSPALIVRGILERSPEGVVNLVADRFEGMPLPVKVSSRDFR